MREEPVKYCDEYARKVNKLYTIVMRIHAIFRSSFGTFLIIWFAMGCMPIVYDELFRAHMHKRNPESTNNKIDRT